MSSVTAGRAGFYHEAVELLLDAGFRPRTTRHFCFGKSAQNHFRPCAALRVPPLPYRIKMARELAPLKQPSPRGRFGTEAPPRPTREPQSIRRTVKPFSLKQGTHHSRKISPYRPEKEKEGSWHLFFSMQSPRNISRFQKPS